MVIFFSVILFADIYEKKVITYGEQHTHLPIFFFNTTSHNTKVYHIYAPQLHHVFSAKDTKRLMFVL